MVPSLGVQSPMNGTGGLSSGREASVNTDPYLVTKVLDDEATSTATSTATTTTTMTTTTSSTSTIPTASAQPLACPEVVTVVEPTTSGFKEDIMSNKHDVSSYCVASITCESEGVTHQTLHILPKEFIASAMAYNVVRMKELRQMREDMEKEKARRLEEGKRKQRFEEVERLKEMGLWRKVVAPIREERRTTHERRDPKPVKSKKVRVGSQQVKKRSSVQGEEEEEEEAPTRVEEGWSEVKGGKREVWRGCWRRKWWWTRTHLESWVG